MPLRFVFGDIARMQADVIVVPTDETYSGQGGADYALHKAAGAQLDEACLLLPPLQVGQAVVTESYDLGCRWLIHTRGPKWQGGNEREEEVLSRCYLNALQKAKELGARSVAMPLISAGTFGFPKDRVLRIAQECINAALREEAFDADELDVTICMLDRKVYTFACENELRRYMQVTTRRRAKEVLENGAFGAAPREAAAPMEAAGENDLDHWLKKHDDNFAITLMKLIDAKGMTDVECYKKANVSRKTFYKIRNDAAYKPSKPTVVAFAIALQLSLSETEMLLRTAGFALSGSLKFDRIIRFYLENEYYDLFEINEALLSYDQPLLGC